MNTVKASLIFLCGGIGRRMNSPIPKQYLPLGENIVALHSFSLLSKMVSIEEIVVVCEDKYKKYFKSSKPLLFARPGKRRQDSVLNGLKKSTGDLICIHDGARPFIDSFDIEKLLVAANQFGAATLGNKSVNTIKKVDKDCLVHETLNRAELYEIYTPQALKRDILEKGFAFASSNNRAAVTDDVSLAELINIKPKIIPCSTFNIKITTQNDLKIANKLLEK